MKTKSSNLIFLNKPGLMSRQNSVVKKKNKKMIESSNSTTVFRNFNSSQFQIRRGKILQWSIDGLSKNKSSNLITFNLQKKVNLVVKNTQKMIESSNSTTMFRNIYRERFQIIWGEILQWSTKNLITKSSNLIFLNEPGLMRRQNSVMKKKNKVIGSSNSTNVSEC